MRRIVKYVALGGCALLFASAGFDEYVTLQPASDGYVPAWVPVGVVVGLAVAGLSLLLLIMLPNPPKEGKKRRSEFE
ncbi:MAG: hypothetical protein QW767_02275 [Thermoprotei archaeon]